MNTKNETFVPIKYGSIEKDVPYCAGSLEAQKMDIYYPGTGGPWPVLVNVHGGAWTGGDKADVMQGIAAYGYLVVSINYRMYPDYRFPAMIEDVKCAIRFLRAHSGKYNLDPERVGLVGDSAGGHLVSLAGLAGRQAGWDTGPYTSEFSQVRAVVDIAGPADLSRSFPLEVKEILKNVFGQDQLVSGSPVTYITSQAPAFLIIHGDADPVVPFEQAKIFHQALTAAGVKNELLVVHNGGHGLEPVGGPVEPSTQEVLQKALAFLEANLKNTP